MGKYDTGMNLFEEEKGHRTTFGKRNHKINNFEKIAFRCKRALCITTDEMIKAILIKKCFCTNESSRLISFLSTRILRKR